MAKRAIVYFGSRFVAEQLGLPEGVSIVSTRCESTRSGVSFVIEGDAIPVNETPDGCCYPLVTIEDIQVDG